MASLIALKIEGCPTNEHGTAWIAYFRGTPTAEDLLTAFRLPLGPMPPREADHNPARYDDAVSKAAGLERWYVCQCV